MTTPKKVPSKGVGVYANGYLLSRVQSISADFDLGEEEARELTNEEVVEYTATDPQVTITIETNDYGSLRNIRAIAEVASGSAADNITVDSFDGTTCDVGFAVQEDSTLKRTLLINNASLTSVSWNYDVGGVATESFTLESDNYQWYKDARRQAFALNDRGGVTFDETLATGSCLIPLAVGQVANYTAAKVYIDGIAVTGAVTLSAASPYCRATWVDTTAESGTNYRIYLYKNTPDATIQQTTSTSQIGSIPRGKLDIYLTTGAIEDYGSQGVTNFLRLQSVSIDADLSRTTLNELGHSRAFERSLETPVPVNITFSALSADLEQWARLSNLDWDDTSDTDYDIAEFTKTANLQIRYFDAQDTSTTRNLLKTLTITDLQVVNGSFALSVGDNATQDFGCRASNFTASGTGTPGTFPLDAAPTD